MRRLVGKIDLTAYFVFLFINGYIKSTLSKKFCTGKTCNTCSGNENFSAVTVHFKLLTVSSDKRINGAISVSIFICVIFHTLKAIETADTAFNRVLLTVFNLLSPMRVCKERSAERNHILYAVLKLLFSLLGRANEICGKNRNIHNLFNLGGKIFSPTALKSCRLKPIIKGIITCRRNINSINTSVA